MRLLAVLLFALSPASAWAGSAFPGGLLDPTGRMAYLGVGSSVTAVDLTAGEVRWTTDQASEPLLVVGDRLYALAPGEMGGLFIRAFDVTDRGRRVFQSEAIEMPRWIVPSNGPNRTFAFRWTREKNRLDLHWHASAWAERAPRKRAAGLARIDLDTGRVKQEDASAPNADTALPTVLEKRSVRWHGRDGGQLRAIVLEESPETTTYHRKQVLVLRRWDERSGKEGSPRELLTARDPAVLADVDGRHLWLRDAAADRHWRVIDSHDGREVAKVPFVAGTLAVTVHDRRAYCLTTRTIRVGAKGRAGRALAAVDVTTGQVIWRRALPDAP